jgi:hypothetical protein
MPFTLLALAVYVPAVNRLTFCFSSFQLTSKSVKLIWKLLPLSTSILFLGTALPAKDPKPTLPPASTIVRDTARNPGNILFETTGVFVNAAAALPPDRYSPLLHRANVTWLALQIDNGGNPRQDNIEALDRGWVSNWKRAGFKVGFWGAPRGVSKHNSDKAVDQATSLVQADAGLAVHLTAKHHGDFYIADCEDSFQAYNPTDPAPRLNRIYVEAFNRAAISNGIANIPRALSSEGRVALDMQPWITNGWDALPQAYWNSYSVYQPSKCVDFYVHETGWPIHRVHPTIATFSGEGENRKVTLREYADDLRAKPIKGFSYYLPESYLGLKNTEAYDQLARMAAPDE